MFMFKSGVFIEELSLFDSGMASLVELSVKNASSDLDFFRLDSDSFSQINGESIDYLLGDYYFLGSYIYVVNR